MAEFSRTASKRAEALTPRAIVEELDRYIVGQHAAKRAVAVALRNRWRRQQVPGPMRDEISPKNIMLIGPTGVGKTEIARRLAKLANAPFIKVEASKFTEVGYVGRDVESMVRDLVETSVNMVREQMTEAVRPEAKRRARERLAAVNAASTTSGRVMVHGDSRTACAASGRARVGPEKNARNTRRHI